MQKVDTKVADEKQCEGQKLILSQKLQSLYSSGSLAEAVNFASDILKVYPEQYEVWNTLGAALAQLGEFDASIKVFKKVIELQPNFSGAYANLGELLRACGKNQEAKEAYEKAIRYGPDSTVAYEALTNLYWNEGSFELAIATIKRALAQKPESQELRAQLAQLLKSFDKNQEAAELYLSLLKQDPLNANHYNDLGMLYSKIGSELDAIECYHKATTIKPDLASAHNNMANVFNKLGKEQEALEYYSKAADLAPHLDSAVAMKLNLAMKFADWSSVEKHRDLIPSLGLSSTPVPPWSMLAMEDSVSKNRIRAENYIKHDFPTFISNDFKSPLEKPQKLRVGYFSADFHSFPGMFLMAGMLERHDQSRFEIMAFSYGPNIEDDMRMRIVEAVDTFVEVSSLTVTEIADLAKQYKLDIAIHRNGHTQNTKTGIFTKRIAPIQINYLGYPGTIGGQFIDYIIGDPVVVPPCHYKHYSEKIITLPHSYQPNDDTRKIVKITTEREDEGLPNDSFIFCCFNSTYKITPIEFDIWMRILTRVPESYLWLLKTNSIAEKNLKEEANKRGVSPSRLVFADKKPQSEHLARHRHADLFLDTFAYNAHTTASDALWAGLPVVTKIGEQFAARVSASLLTALDLQELITDSEKDYEELIISLARQPFKLNKIRAKLEANRLEKPLFDTARYTRNFEMGLHKAYDLFFQGKVSENIIVEE